MFLKFFIKNTMADYYRINDKDLFCACGRVTDDKFSPQENEYIFHQQWLFHQ